MNSHPPRPAPLLLLLVGAVIAPGLAGCLQETDDEPEDAGLLGADTLGLELAPGFTEEGIDPPTDTDTGPTGDPFAGYDCETASAYDDICEYDVCQLKDTWDTLVEDCGQGYYSADVCAQYLSCMAGYVECAEDHCDSQTGISNSDWSQCAQDAATCYGY